MKGMILKTVDGELYQVVTTSVSGARLFMVSVVKTFFQSAVVDTMPALQGYRRTGMAGLVDVDQVDFAKGVITGDIDLFEIEHQEVD